MGWVGSDVLPEIRQELRGELGQHHDIPKDKLQPERGAEAHAQHLGGGARHEQDGGARAKGDDQRLDGLRDKARQARVRHRDHDKSQGYRNNPRETDADRGAVFAEKVMGREAAQDRQVDHDHREGEPEANFAIFLAQNRFGIADHRSFEREGLKRIDEGEGGHGRNPRLLGFFVDN